MGLEHNQSSQGPKILVIILGAAFVLPFFCISGCCIWAIWLDQPTPEKVRKEIALGDFEEARTELAELREEEPDHPELDKLTRELDEAEWADAKEAIEKAIAAGSGKVEERRLDVARLRLESGPDEAEVRELLVDYHQMRMERCVGESWATCRLETMEKIVEIDPSREAELEQVVDETLATAASHAAGLQGMAARHGVLAGARDVLLARRTPKGRPRAADDAGRLRGYEVALEAIEQSRPLLGATIEDARYLIEKVHASEGRKTELERVQSNTLADFWAVESDRNDLTLYLTTKGGRVDAIAAMPSPYSGVLDPQALDRTMERLAGTGFSPEKLSLGAHPDARLTSKCRPDDNSSRCKDMQLVREKQATWVEDGELHGVIWWKDSFRLAHIGAIETGAHGLPREIERLHHAEMRDKHYSGQRANRVRSRTMIVPVFFPSLHTPPSYRSRSVRSGSRGSSRSGSGGYGRGK